MHLARISSSNPEDEAVVGVQTVKVFDLRPEAVMHRHLGTWRSGTHAE